MFDACCLQLVHNISQFCHNTSWCSLSFPEVLIVDFSSHRLNLKINRIILTSSMSKLHFRWSRNKPYLLFYSFNFWSKLLASSTGPSSRKLRSEWRLSSEGMFCTSIWLEYESRKIFFEDCTLLLIKENSCFKKGSIDTSASDNRLLTHFCVIYCIWSRHLQLRLKYYYWFIYWKYLLSIRIVYLQFSFLFTCQRPIAYHDATSTLVRQNRLTADTTLDLTSCLLKFFQKFSPVFCISEKGY